MSSPALPGKGEPFLPQPGCTHDTPNKTPSLLCLEQLRLVSVPCNQSPDQHKSQKVGMYLGKGSWKMKKCKVSQNGFRQA